jgi:tRNA modification GTPase
MTPPTRLARLTPVGVGAIATLALRGPAAWTLVRDLARRPLPAEPTPGRFWWTPLGEAGGAADEVVIAVKQTAPQPWLELHCHGGREIVRLLEELFAARGVEICTWQQLEDDPLHAAALAVLTGALTVRTAAIALDQYQGALARALEEVRSALTRGDLEAADRVLADLERHAPVGRHLAVPWRVVIAGAPNVGKSSLVNALAGYQRSVVSAVPGTTRDVVTTLLAVDGWPIEVADTAGWRSTGDALEREGVARATAAMAAADLCLWVVDAAATPVWPAADAGPVRVVVNKIDLPAAWPLEGVEAVRVSARTGAGLGELCQAIAGWLVPEVPPPGAAVPFSAAVAAVVTAVRDLVRAGAATAALDRLTGLIE